MADKIAAQNPASWFSDDSKNPLEENARNRQTSDVEGENPYKVSAELDSTNGEAGGQPGVMLNIKGSNHG